jgi:hypothetical protein
MRKLRLPIAIFVGLSMLLYSGDRLYRKRTEARQAAIRTEISALRKEMRGAYRKRGALLRAWAGPSARTPEFDSLLVENDGLELATPAEFQRFDFVQERLNGKVSALHADRKAAARKPVEWEATERAVLTARANYAKRALAANRARDLPEAVPLFGAEAALAEARK